MHQTLGCLGVPYTNIFTDSVTQLLDKNSGNLNDLPEDLSNDCEM